MSADTPQPSVAWSDLRRAFAQDGSLRDIVIQGATSADWARAIDYVGRLGTSGLARVESDPDPLPPSIEAIIALRQDRMVILSVFLDLVQLNCFFFGGDEIEFDLSPNEVSSEPAARSVMAFMQGLGDAVRRPVHLTEENVHNWRWLTYAPAVKRGYSTRIRHAAIQGSESSTSA